MTKSNASKIKGDKPIYTNVAGDVVERQALLSPPPAPPAAFAWDGFSPSILDQIKDQASEKHVSTARYFTFDKNKTVHGRHTSVCFHAIAENCSGAQGLGIIFQGYPGFSEGDRWRKATEEDLYMNKTYPFVQKDGGHYTNESLEWLRFLLDPAGPFKSLLPLMAENTPEQVQERRAFIFPDVSSIPARLTWCFAIASRLGFANARTLWRYLHLLEKGLSRPLAALIAGGFEHEIRAGEVSGQIIKSYTCGFLGVDTTTYAGRFLTSSPVEDKPFKNSHPGTYSSSDVFASGKIDLKNLRFPDWDAVIKYTEQRRDEQIKELCAKAA